MFLLSFIVIAVAAVSHYHRIEFVSGHTFGFLVIGYALLALACLIPGKR